MAGDIVPIELGLTQGDLVTLWVPRWHEGDDEWQAFLGQEDDLYGFTSVADLAAFIRTDTDNDLVEHPAWGVLSGLSAAELEPEENFSFDLVGVPELAANDPEDLVVSKLEDALNMARNLGEACDLDVVNKFFNANQVLDALSAGVDAFEGRDGEDLWSEIGTAIAKGWDDVLDAVDAVVATPEVDAEAVAIAEAELVAADENTVDVDDVVEEAEEDAEFVSLDADEGEDEESEEVEESFWGEVGVDPIKIITAGETYFTLRCYLDEEAIFLGRDGMIFVFTSERALARFLADNHEHALAGLSTYEQIQVAAVDGSLEVEVTDGNVYVLPGLADDLAAGPKSVDADQLDLAVELITDAADFAGDKSVEADLATSTPLGWYVSFILDPDPTRLAPSAPFNAEAEAWRVLEREFEARLRNT
ncbi:primosomal protein [Rhodococcus sp. NPDC049939]|uniref:primosomal protein n=1 Tax=Rhodococcus sp. NPDC049939 TaxID=3155511 RepID=UPI0033D24D6D